ncbi:MAG: 4Fe-4S dicluster domain-containing protein [bacterium]
MDRRTFLKTAGLGSITFAYGCNQSKEKHLFSVVTAPEDMVTGKATWYASTCAECPAGCGVIAKNREGRIIKLEGNPNHPVNNGKLCIRGQSALQAVYDPDRLTTPKLKVNGVFKDIGFDQAFSMLQEKIKKAGSGGKNRIKMVSGIVGDPLYKLFSIGLSEWNAGPPVLYEPFAQDSMKAAHQALLSRNQLPTFQLEKSDFILGFGADFLETWLSPVEYAGKFKAMHGITNGKKGRFIHVAPYMSLTAANADKYLCVKPGTEVVVALGIINRLLEKAPAGDFPQPFIDQLKQVVSPYSAETVTKETGLAPADQETLVRNLLSAKHPLVLGGATPTQSSFALEMSVTLINLLLDHQLSLYDFNSRHGIEKVNTTADVIQYINTASSEPTDLFLFYQTNPLFTLPPDTGLEKIFSNNTIFKVSFSNFLDETSEAADLVFPVKLYLEGWDVYESKTGMVSTSQPAMGRLTKASPIGDLFIRLTSQEKTYSNYQHFLMDQMLPKSDTENPEPWFKMIEAGGNFASPTKAESTGFSLNPESVRTLEKALAGKLSPAADQLTFLAVPSLRHYDGRGGNKAWLSEIPDPITSIAWESMLMIHPETLAKQGLKQGDLLNLEAGGRSIQAPVYSYSGVCPGLIVMQTGMGHQNFGRYAAGFGSNPLRLLSGQTGSEGVAFSYLTPLSGVKKTGTVDPLPKTDGSRSQYERKIAVSEVAGHENKDAHVKEGLTMNTFPVTLPVEEGYADKRDVYSAHAHEGYRWGLIVDLDRCIGCAACVASCYAENNIGVVGKTQIANGREMSWLRIERYEDLSDKERLIFLPMLCQHCDNAPCEAVCPVYAPYHNKEGLNSQIYNRCIGTRFCAQNCPYKVRRFNWLDWEWPEPLNLQLNPNVTVRSKGVMEKCSFCVQRIKEAHNQAKNENRPIRDGEIQPACVQTCPTNALVFGNFQDKNSKLYTLAKDPRAYQVLGYLNTKPAVIYLKKILQPV